MRSTKKQYKATIIQAVLLLSVLITGHNADCTYSSSEYYIKDYSSLISDTSNIQPCLYMGKLTTQLSFLFVEQIKEDRQNIKSTYIVTGGQKGASALQYAFTETGLFSIFGEGVNQIIRTKKNNNLAQLGDVLYIDGIKGVGIQKQADQFKAYETNDYPKDRDTVAQLIYQSLIEISNQFTRLNKNPIILLDYENQSGFTIELAELISKQSDFKANIKHIVLRNPILDIQYQSSSQRLYVKALGTISKEEDQSIEGQTRKCQIAVLQKKTDALDICNEGFQLVSVISGVKNGEDLKYQNSQPNQLLIKNLTEIFNKEQVIKALNLKFGQDSIVFQNEKLFPILMKCCLMQINFEILQKVLQTTKVTIIGGEYDSIQNPLGLLFSLGTLSNEYSDFEKTPSSPLKYDNKILGTHRIKNNLELIIQNDIGGTIQYIDPELAIETIKYIDSINQFQNTTCADSTKKKDTMSKCQNGQWNNQTCQCVCSQGYTDIGCSASVKEFQDGIKPTLKGRSIVYYKVPIDDDLKLEVVNQPNEIDLDLYISSKGPAVESNSEILSKISAKKNTHIFLKSSNYPNKFAYITIFNPTYQQSGTEVALVLTETLFGERRWFLESKIGNVLCGAFLILCTSVLIFSCFCFWRAKHEKGLKFQRYGDKFD